MEWNQKIGWLLTTACLWAGSFADAADSYYKQPPLFSTAPSPEKSLQTIARFGPVGMGIDLIQPAFTMKIHNIEEGSPAAAAGKLKAGQIIETINGQRLAEIDPRIQLGQIIARAEATDGVIEFRVKDAPSAKAQQVVVKVPVLGAYSKTWPLDCPKSQKIVRGFADYLAKPGSHKGFGGIGMLLLLSTGEEKDLAVVQGWARGAANRAPTYAWHLGYGGIPLCEYYLRTGDETVLPGIQRWVDSATGAQFFGGWAGRGGVPSVTYGGGGGHLNAGGTAVVTFLVLAKECGADVDDRALLGALRQFYRFAGRGNNPYGNGRPELGFVDNGKNGNLSFAMAAAASLTPGGEQSVYAGARDACAATSFYTTTFMLHGHTGGGIGEIWRSAAMGLLHDKMPAQYREFMDNRQWHYDLSRRFDGSFGILGGARYDNVQWGAGYALAYTAPRKTLRVTGAPPSKFSTKYKLPQRPWGTKADDAFASIEPAAYQDGTRPDLSGETLAGDSAIGLLKRLASPDLSDETIRRCAHHRDHAIRLFAARKAAGLSSSYLGRAAGGGGEKRPALILELLWSNDARVRRAVVHAVSEGYSGEELQKFLAPEVLDLLIGMLCDDEESWWVKDAVLNLLGRTSADVVAPHVDVILPYLKHEEWWLQNAALSALAPVVADERCYRKVLPAIGEMLRTCQLYNATAPVRWGTLPENLRAAGPEVQKLAAETLKESYAGFTGVRKAPGGQNITGPYDSQLEVLATSLANVPGGYDVLYEIAKERFPNDPLPYAKVFLSADPEKFGPELRGAIAPIIREKLIYEYIGRNRRRLLPEAKAARQNSFVFGSLDGLTALYRKVGVHDYDWHAFGPDLSSAAWDYFTFDPPEKLAYDVTPWRYREVTYPKGMENWFMPEFDPGKAGWKKGRSPFGQYQGKLVTDAPRCSNLDCAHTDPMRTLWDKEALLVRGTLQFPPLRPGHIYRIRVGMGQHVGSGDGYRIYINGRQLIETKYGVGRRQGAKPRGGFITKQFVEEFNKGPVTIAATSFLRYGSRAIVTMPPVPQGIFSLWLEEMKLPPISDEAIRKSATVIPMLSSRWQAKQDPDKAELQTDDDMFRYDGRFVANPGVLGSWTIVDQVATVDEFHLERQMDPGRPTVTRITFQDKGLTSDALRIWSGDTLMDLERYQAMKMTVERIGGDDYLFIEAGGFGTRNPVGWQSPWYVMKRQ